MASKKTPPPVPDKPPLAFTASDVRTAFAGWFHAMVTELHTICIELEEGPLKEALGPADADEYRTQLDMAMDSLKSEGPRPDAVSAPKLMEMIEAVRKEFHTP